MIQVNHILPLFPEVVGIYNTSTDSNKIVKILEKSKWNVRNSGLGLQGDSGAYGGDDFNFFSKTPELKKHSKECVDHYIKEVLKWKTNYRITTSWATKVKPGGFAGTHFHANSWLSGVYYPIGDENFKIRFHDSKHKQWWNIPTEYTINNSGTWNIPIVNDNTLIIFNSLLNHEILPNKSNKTRYSIAFNVFPKGFMGEKSSDSSIHL